MIAAAVLGLDPATVRRQERWRIRRQALASGVAAVLVVAGAVSGVLFRSRAIEADTRSRANAIALQVSGSAGTILRLLSYWRRRRT